MITQITHVAHTTHATHAAPSPLPCPHPFPTKQVKTKMAMSTLCEVYRAARVLWPLDGGGEGGGAGGGATEGVEEVKDSDEAAQLALEGSGDVVPLDPMRPTAVTIEIAQLKARIIDDIFMPSYDVRDAWVLVKKNASEATVELRPTADINKFNTGKLRHRPVPPTPRRAAPYCTITHRLVSRPPLFRSPAHLNLLLLPTTFTQMA